jgi:hypothetical protein
MVLQEELNNFKRNEV